MVQEKNLPQHNITIQYNLFRVYHDMNISKTNVAVVWGAGGIGRAMAELLAEQKKFSRVILVSREVPQSIDGSVQQMQADMLNEVSIQSAVGRIAGLGDVQLVVVAAGMLHDGELQPEKTMRQLSPDAMQRIFEINSIGPALLAKHFFPVMPRKSRAVFAAMSARVGSISDNRLGGWYAYRASKAALNMLLKTLSIEWKRRNPLSICVGLHPGTVDTGLSKPFQRGVAKENLFSPSQSAARLVNVLAGLKPDDSGHVFAYDGTRIPE